MKLMRIIRGLEYAPGCDLNAYMSLSPRGAVLLLTSCWLEGDEGEASGLAELLCNAGFTVFATSFRLDPSGPSGVALSDACAALSWIATSEMRFERREMVVMGCGIAGTVAIEVGLRESIPVVAWSAVIDFRAFMDSTASLGDSDHTRDYHSVDWGQIKDSGEQVPFLRSVILAIISNNLSLLTAMNPVSRVVSSAGPMLLMGSTREVVPAAGVALMEKALKGQGIPCAVDLMEGAGHATDYLDQALPGTIRFIGEALSGTDTRRFSAK